MAAPVTLALLLQAAVTFSVVGPGTVTATGLYTAPATASGTALVIARCATCWRKPADTAVVTFVAGGSIAGVPFGPYGAWSGTTVSLPAPFTAGMGSTGPQYLAGLLANLEARNLHAVVNPFGGGADLYLTAGRFDLAKWRAKLQAYASLVPVVQAAYRRGQILGLVVLDEPYNPKWGGALTKPMVDGMCGEVQTMFGVPAGVTHEHDKFFPGTRYLTCDFLLNQYSHRLNQGDAPAYKNAALSWAAASGMATVFSLNILDGGVQAARDGRWACDPILTAGRGTYEPNCRMTAHQVRTWGTLFGSAGCALTLWRNDAGFMAKADNQAAFRDVATALAHLPRKGCGRP